MADTADQEIIRIVAQDATEGGIKGAEQRMKAAATRMAAVGRIPMTIVDKISTPLRAIGDQFQAVGRIAERASIATVASMMTRDLAENVKAGIDRVQEFGTATLALQRETGTTTEQASSLLAVLNEFGVEDPSKSLGIFARGIHGIEDASEKALNGGKGVADAMRDLGISFVDAQKNARPMNDVLLDVADRFHAMPDGVDKTAIAMQLFGRSGRDMIRFLDLGAEGIKEAQAAAQRFGMVLTTENAVSLKEFAAVQRESTEASHGLELQLGLLMLPVLTRVAQGATFVAVSINEHVVPALRGLAPTVESLLSIGGRFVSWLRGEMLLRLMDLWELLSPTRTFLGYALRWLIETAWPAFLAAMSRVGAFISDTLLPRLRDLSDWLGQHIRPALDWLANTAWPAMQTAAGAVASWINANVVPALQRLWEWLRPHLQDAIDWAVGTGWPAMMGALDAFDAFLRTQVVPALGDLWNWLRPQLADAVDWFVNTGWPALNTALDAFDVYLRNTLIPAIQDTAGAIRNDLGSALSWVTDTGFPGAQAAAEGFRGAMRATVAEAGARGAWDDLKNAWTDLQQAGSTLSEVVTGLYNALSGVSAPSSQAGQAIEATGSQFNIAADIVKSFTDRLQSFTDGAVTAAAMIRAIGDAFNFVGQSIDNVGGAVARLRDVLVSAGASPATFIANLFGGTAALARDLTTSALTASTAADIAAPPGPPATGFANAFQSGGWLTEPIVGYGMDSGQRYTFAEDRKPEYVVPAGGGGAGGSGGGSVTLTVQPGAVVVNGAAGPAQGWADAAEELFADLHRRLDAAMSNRPKGIGRGAY